VLEQVEREVFVDGEGVEEGAGLEDEGEGEAVARLDLGQKQVLMFRNRANGQFNVVYRRADAAIGWIDPGTGNANGAKR